MAKVLVLGCVCLCLQLVACQFGFFPNQREREERRHGNPFSFVQNMLPDTSRMRNRVSGLLHFRPETPNSNPAYVYPFNNRPIANDGYYDQYGRPSYPYQHNRPQQYPNYDDQYYGKPVRFPPQYPGQPDFSQSRPIFVPDYPEGGDYNPPASNDDVVTNPGFSKPVEVPSNNGPKDEYVENNYSDMPITSRPVEPATLPSLTSAPASDVNAGFSQFKPVPEAGSMDLQPLSPEQSSEPNSGFSSLKPETESMDLPPLSPVQPLVPNPSFPSFKPESEPKKLPALVPVPPSESKTEFPPFNPVKLNPETQPKALPPLTPVPPSESKTEFPPFKPVEPKPETEPKALPPLTPVPPSESKTESAFRPVPESDSKESPPFTNPIESSGKSEFPKLNPVPESGSQGLSALTPVPPSETRDNFNFGTQGLFHETCQTPEGGIGSCVSVFDCAPFLELLQQSKSNPALVQMLRQAHCGFEGNNPKVCCPRPGFPTSPPQATTTTTTTAAPPVEPEDKSDQGHSEDLINVLPEPPVCGVSNASLSRVVGGVDAHLGDFPWMALLGYMNRRTQATKWLCGGSLITSKHVLTAAHCIHGHEVDLHVVRVGELDLAKEDDGATPVDVLIKSKIKHEDYNANAYTNDIGILVLERSVQFTVLIRPICIPRSNELRARSFENYTPIIAGWGDIEFRGPSATHLQALQLPVVSNEFCAQAYSAYKAQTIDERVLCAGYKKGGKDACQGDSGGPLMQPIWNPKALTTHFYQIGVVSYGKKCAEAGFPGVYTRVTNFAPWIEMTVAGTA